MAGMHEMGKIVNTLMQMPDSVDFREPVDWRGLGLDDYPRVIAKPMDLGTVKQKIERQGYKSINDCAADIRLIWCNCKAYNGQGSDFHNLADRLSKRFEELFSKVKPETKKRDRDAAAIDLTEEASPQEKKMRQSINDVAADLVCPITQELPFDPVMAEDGKIYERNAIVEWLGREQTSPVTRARMGVRLLPAIQTRNTIETLIKSGAIEGELAMAWQAKLVDEELVKETRAEAEGGDGDSMCCLGVWYNFGLNGLAKDFEQARAWFERSAATRDPRGLSYFGRCLLRGTGGPQNNALGLVYFTDAAHLGSNHAAFKLGEAFFKGTHDLPKDRVQARFWLKKALDDECEVKHLSDKGISRAKKWLRALGE